MRRSARARGPAPNPGRVKGSEKIAAVKALLRLPLTAAGLILVTILVCLRCVEESALELTIGVDHVTDFFFFFFLSYSNNSCF